jgi:hypothetical protein
MGSRQASTALRTSQSENCRCSETSFYRLGRDGARLSNCLNNPRDENGDHDSSRPNDPGSSLLDCAQNGTQHPVGIDHELKLHKDPPRACRVSLAIILNIRPSNVSTFNPTSRKPRPISWQSAAPSAGMTLCFFAFNFSEQKTGAIPILGPAEFFGVAISIHSPASIYK